MNIGFKDTPGCTAEEQQELFKALVTKALEEKVHTQPEFIKNTSEWWTARACKAGLYKVITLFDTLATALYKAYCKAVLKGTADFNMLFVYRQYLECKHFYEEELALIQDMLEEYWVYVFSGHFCEQFLFFRERESWHLWDHREDNNGRE